MLTTNLTQNTVPVNPQTHTFIRSSEGSILVGESPLEVLTWLARTSEKIKLFDTYNGQEVRFMNGRVQTVEITTETYDNFLAHLKATGWTLRPAVTSGGYTAIRIN